MSAGAGGAAAPAGAAGAAGGAAGHPGGGAAGGAGVGYADGQAPYVDFQHKTAVGGSSAASDAMRTKAIAAIEFGMMNGEEVMRASALEICSRELYKMGTRTPTPFGVLDLRLGVSNKTDTCGTCGKKLADCAGHFGFLKLELPVFHIGFLRATIELLQCICKTCSRVLLSPDARKGYIRMMRNPSFDSLRKAKMRKKITEECKKMTLCPWCHALVGQVKKVTGAQSFKIIHDRYKHASDMSGSVRLVFESTMDTAVAMASELAPHIKRSHEDLTPLRVQELFARIPTDDLSLIWANERGGNPRNMIITHLPVSPVCIRPSVPMENGGGSNEDDITVKMQEIINVNTALRVALQRGASARMVAENWDFLQVQVAALFNGDLPGLPLAMKSKRPIRGLSQRLKGKQGRFRGNLSGKRVDFSSRTVISPDPNLPLYCVGVPVLVAKDLTYPEKVTSSNIAYLRRLVENGPDIHPGANYIKKNAGHGDATTGGSVGSSAGATMLNLRFGDRTRAARELQIGDIVERHLRNGDPVLFNRQPSLHKMSIMCHRAVVLPWRTFRFNECVCTPYNADFDGDEMNLHLPQTEEARAEAALLMDVRENLITPRSGEPLVAATQDFLTAAYLLTRRDTFLTKDEICQAAATLSDATEHVDLPPPALLKPVPLWTGKQVINLLLRPNKSIALHASFECKARNYSGSGEHMDPDDGYVVFRDGALMAGNLDKGLLGGGSKKGLVYMLCRDVHPSVAARALHRLTKMTSRWLQSYGFSIGVEDVAPAASLRQLKEATVAKGYEACNEAIAKYKKGTLTLQPGCNEEQSLEVILNGILSRLRDELGNICMRELSQHNPPKIMATCGSKGSTINIAQMVACVGQQSVGGSRIQEGFVDRTLPAFPAKAKEPPAKGFVANSFYTGLTGYEFFFHTMGGREGLVDTAVKTAETGYMQRRMVKALEDLSVQYDSTVRTSRGDIVQFTYGDDGLDPAFMEGNGRPADLGRLWAHASLQARSGAHISGGRAAEMVGSRDTSALAIGVLGGTSASAAGGAASSSSAGGKAGKASSSSSSSSSDAHHANGGGVSGMAEQEPDLSPAEIRHLVRAALVGPLFRDFHSRYAGAAAASVPLPANSGTGSGALAATAEASLISLGADAVLSTHTLLAKKPAAGVDAVAAAVAAVIAAAGGPAASSSSASLPLDRSVSSAYGADPILLAAQPGAPLSSQPVAMTVGGQRFLDEVAQFFEKNVAQAVEKRLVEAGLTQAAMGTGSKGPKAPSFVRFDQQLLNTGFPTVDADADGDPIPAPAAPAPGSVGWAQEGAAIVHHTVPVTRSAVLGMLEAALGKYRRARIQPGEAVGAVAAHSLGEPATQMTLKTFHFAGVASMNVTLGVPRIKEIMNASRAISTPIMEAALANDTSEIAARVVKARLEKTTLGDIASWIRECYDGSGAHLEVRLDTAAIAALHLHGVDAPYVARAIVKCTKLRLKDEHVSTGGTADTVIVRPPARKAASRQRAERQRAKERQREEERLEMEGHGTGKGGKGSKSGKSTVAREGDFFDGEDVGGDEDEGMGGGGGGLGGAGEGGEEGGLLGEMGGDDGGMLGDDGDHDDGMDGGDIYGVMGTGRGGRGGAGGRGGGGSGHATDYIASMRQEEREDTYYGIQALKADLPGVLVQGIPTVSRAVITQLDSAEAKKLGKPPGGPTRYKLLVEGYDLLRVMGTPGVNPKHTRSNHVIEVHETLGVEAARSVIQSELEKTYGSYGIGIDPRHLQLLADTMTYRGEVLGITRFGIAKMKDSVLMLASFEKTPDHLFDAALHSRVDTCKGVSESIIIGQPIPVGTGLFSLMHGIQEAASGPAAAAAAAAAGAAAAGSARAASKPGGGRQLGAIKEELDDVDAADEDMAAAPAARSAAAAPSSKAVRFAASTSTFKGGPGALAATALPRALMSQMAVATGPPLL